MKALATNAASANFRRRSLKVAADVPDEIPQNDDEAERQQRRRDSGKFTQLAEKRLSVGTSSSGSGTGTSFVEFSATELVAQYENCIKLSFANKINHKNAFSLPLIDCMKALLKKKDAQMNNFQFVSCTLDASAKIYASRVDRVHMDGLNFAQNLGVQPRCAAVRAGSDNSDDEAEGEVDPKASKTKKKYRKRRRNLDDTSKITLALKQHVEQDATYTYMRKQFSNCQPGFTSFVPRLAVKGDGCRVLLDLREPLLSPPPAASAPAAKEDEFVDVPVDLSADLSTKFLCPTYRDILNCDADNIDYDALLQPSQNMDDTFDNDLDAGGPIDFGAGGDDFPCEAIDDDINAERGFNETMATSTLSGPVAAACCPGGDRRENIVDVRPSNAVSIAVQNVVDGSLENMTIDYSPQHLERLLWAGPAHWRQLPLCKARAVQQVQAETARRKERRSSSINFFGELKDIELVSSKRTTISAAFMSQNWSVQKVTNPTDLHLDFKVLTRLFLRPEVEVFKLGSPMGTKKKAGSHSDDNDGDHDVCQYDYDNVNDSQCFCPDVNQEESFDGSEGADGGRGANNEEPAEDIHAMDSQMGQGEEWQMVAPPLKVARVVVNYAQHAKKVDIKKLKKILWKILIEEGNKEDTGSSNREAAVEGVDEPVDDPTTEDMMMMKNSVLFSRLYMLVLERAPKDMVPDLSVAFVLTALLHLANEKVLHVKNLEDSSDIIIFQDQSAAPIVHRHDKRQYK